MKIRVSEIFSSFQGEGRFTGMPSLWIRLFGCNLRCDGFGQKDPTDANSYILPYKDINVKKYKSMTDLPVFSYGCDSSYSWESKFKRLTKDYTEQQIVDELEVLGKSAFGIDIAANRDTVHAWCHPVTKTPVQLCFTGGEPMLQQTAINRICKEFHDRGVCPPQITIETNASKPITTLNLKLMTQHFHLSCSPKLYSVSGEKEGIQHHVLQQYYSECDSGALKFVHNGSQRAWDELDEVISHLGYMTNDKNWTFWIMPAHATIETGESEYVGALCDEAMKRGFMISLRTHVYAYGNQIGK